MCAPFLGGGACILRNAFSPPASIIWLTYHRCRRKRHWLDVGKHDEINQLITHPNLCRNTARFLVEKTKAHILKFKTRYEYLQETKIASESNVKSRSKQREPRELTEFCTTGRLFPREKTNCTVSCFIQQDSYSASSCTT